MSTNPVSSACAGAGGRLLGVGRRKGASPPPRGRLPGRGGGREGHRSPVPGHQPPGHLLPLLATCRHPLCQHLGIFRGTSRLLCQHIGTFHWTSAAPHTSYLPPPPPPPPPPLPSPLASLSPPHNSTFISLDFFLNKTEFKLSPHCLCDPFNASFVNSRLSTLACFHSRPPLNPPCCLIDLCEDVPLSGTV